MIIDINMKDKIRKCGLRVTPQRAAVMEVLSRTKKHPDADTIYRDVRNILPSVTLATVYNTLKALSSAGIIQEVSTGTGFNIRRYDGNSSSHPHVICIGCKKVEDVEGVDAGLLDAAGASVRKNTKYRMLRELFNFYGYCPECSRGSERRIKTGEKGGAEV